MFEHRTRVFVSGLLIALLLGGLLPLRAGAQPPAKKRIDRGRTTPKKARVVSPEESPRRRVHPRKAYVRTRRDYGHVRVTHRQASADGRLNMRPVIVRSARVTPRVLERFEDPKQDQIRLAIRHFREGHRAEGLRIWGVFIDGLSDYREPIDLDDIMLYVAREGSFSANGPFLFHAAKLEFLRESARNLEDYVDLLYEQRDICSRAGYSCPSTMLRELEYELARARADLEILDIETRAASDEFESLLESARDAEQRFAAVFDDMYREVELRIRLSP